MCVSLFLFQRELEQMIIPSSELWFPEVRLICVTLGRSLGTILAPLFIPWLRWTRLGTIRKPSCCSVEAKMTDGSLGSRPAPCPPSPLPSCRAAYRTLHASAEHTALLTLACCGQNINVVEERSSAPFWSLVKIFLFNCCSTKVYLC